MILKTILSGDGLQWYAYFTECILSIYYTIISTIVIYFTIIIDSTYGVIG